VCLSKGHGEPAVVVDREASGERTRLRPLCETHAGGATLRAAAPVEAALLAAYRVDVLPDARVRRIRREPDPRRVRRVGVLAAAAALAFAVAIGVAVFGHGREPTAAAGPSFPPPGVVAHAGRQDGPVARTGDGLRTVTHAKLAALSPFATVHCGTITPNGVQRTLSCADPSSDVFVENFGPVGEHRFGTCTEHTVAKTVEGDRILCWRAMSTP
jgi:hypothetical protein